MSTRARVQAYLGMDVSAFSAGLTKVNGMLAAFKRGAKVGGLRGFGGLLGAGAIVQGFRSILQAAQDARTEAKALGMEVSTGVASVAAYADRWDMIKENIQEAGIAALSFFTTAGRAIGKKLGTGSSDEEVGAIQQNKEDQKQREIDLKNNRARLDREMAATDKSLSDARRANRLAEMSDAERMNALTQEQYELFVEIGRLTPGSLAAKKAALALEQKFAEVRELNAKMDKKEQTDPSAMKGNRTAFGMSVEEVASRRGPGRRSERERLAAEVMQLQERGRSAEAGGRFSLAKSFRDRAVAKARENGFGDAEGSVGAIRRGGAGGGSGAGAAAAGPTWDSKYGGELAARNAALNARYGGDYQRPQSFVDMQNAKGNDAASDLKSAAAELKEAGAAIKNATIEIEVEDS
jgi:hypothetical protein